MFGWEFPPHNSGGLGVACYGLSRALAESGVDVTFVLPRRMKTDAPWCKVVFADERPELDIPDELVRRFQSGYVSEEEYQRLITKYPALASVRSSLLEEVMQYGVLARRVALEEEHDVIHAHDWLSFLAGMEAREVSDKPFIAHVHATEFDRTGGGGVNQAVYDIERAGIHAADQVIAVSSYTKQVLVEHYGIEPDKVEVVHNGIDHDDATIVRSVENLVHALQERGNDIVLFVGRLTIQKGPDYFLRAAKKVLAVRPNTVFIFAGSGDMEERLIHEAAFEGISDRVLFVGFLRGNALAQMYSLADIAVMPSVSEPFGIVPLEAMHNGTPVIISKQSGVSEVVKNALKVDFWDTDEMANQLLAILNHASLRETLRDQGAREVLGVVWKRAAQKCVLVYHRVVHALSRA
ncbi:glycosyltransferase [Patescibacteria group bacterium]|nr:glycosyltransferase [Patescibacteria group bacterium]